MRTRSAAVSAHPQFFDAQSTAVVGIEADLRMILRRHAQGFLSQLLQGQQHFPFVGEQHIDVGTGELHHDLRIFEIRMRGFALRHDVFDIEVGRVQYWFEEIFDERAGFSNRIFLVGQGQLLLFFLETTLATCGGGEMRFNAHCCTTATMFPVNQYSTNPDDAK